MKGFRRIYACVICTRRIGTTKHRWCKKCEVAYHKARAKGDGTTPSAVDWAAKRARRFVLKMVLLNETPADEQPGHVDEFIWRAEFVKDDNMAYARWMLMHFRLPAHTQVQWDRFMRDRRLYCTWQGQRYRVTGASRLGDVWLAADFEKDHGYDQRVQVAECSAWGAAP